MLILSFQIYFFFWLLWIAQISRLHWLFRYLGKIYEYKNIILVSTLQPWYLHWRKRKKYMETSQQQFNPYQYLNRFSFLGHFQCKSWWWWHLLVCNHMVDGKDKRKWTKEVKILKELGRNQLIFKKKTSA